MMLAGTRARLVPLPFVRPPLWSGSCSRRVRQRFNRTMAVNRRTNAVIRAVNSLSNCDTSSGAMFPSVFERARPDYFEPGIAECLRDPPSGVLSYFKNVNPPPRAQVRLVAQIFKSASDYVCRLGSSPSSDDVAEPGAGVFSYLSSPNSQNAVPLVASRVSLPTSAATCQLLDLLPPHLARLYSSPAGLVKSPLLCAPPPRVSLFPRGTDPAEYVKLLRRMKAAGMVSFRRHRPKVINGVFTVPKGDLLRLIVDARRANVLFEDPGAVDLPTPDVLSRLVASVDEPLFVGKADVDNFYHRILLPEWLWEYFGLPPVDAADVGEQGGGLVYPVCITLPMGWTHSVFVGQSLHEHQIDESGAFEPASKVCRASTDVVLDRTRYAVYLDDMNALAVDAPDGAQRMQVYLQHMAEVGLPQKLSKHVPLTQDPVEVLGLELHRDRYGASPAKLEALCAKTRAVLAGRACSGDVLRRLVGEWTWVMLVRRPVLAVFGAVYRFCDSAQGRCVPVWGSVRKELNMIMDLVPLLFCPLSAGFSSRVLASDASTTGFGVCAARVAVAEVRAVMAQKHSLLDDGRMAPAAGVPLLVQRSRWASIVSAPTRREEHINVLELRALILAIRWFLSLGRPPDPVRVLSLIDSSVCLFSVNKGRSSSFQLLRLLRALSALLLAGGLFLTTAWVPTHLNPADAPSRAWE